MRQRHVTHVDKGEDGRCGRDSAAAAAAAAAPPALGEVEDALVGGVDFFEAGERAGERAEGVGVVYGREGEGGAVGGVEGPGGLLGEFLGGGLASQYIRR